MQIITTHKGTDFDAAAFLLAAKEAVAVLPKSLNPNVRDFLSIHKDLFDIQPPDKIELEEVISLIISFLRPTYGESQRKILTRMLQSAQRRRLGGYQIGINKLNITGHVNNLAVVFGMYREILDVDAAFGIFFHQKRDNIIVIGIITRSDTMRYLYDLLPE